MTEKEKQILESVIKELQMTADANLYALKCPGNSQEYITQTKRAITLKYKQITLLKKIMHNAMWIKTKDLLPEYPKDTPCLVWYNNEVTILWWNAYYKSWDTIDGDDHECDAFGVEYWMPLPEGPNKD